MEIKLVTNKKEWGDCLLATQAPASFLQSWEWGEILVSENKTVERLAVTDGKNILGAAHVVYTALPFGWRYAFCAGGPTVKLTTNKEQLTDVWGCFKNYFLSKKIVFFRVEPSRLLIDNCSLLINKTIDINPRATLIIDLIKSEEALLSEMHQKTRYNIHLAEKKGLTVTVGKNFDVFWNLMKKTGDRDGFRLHYEQHYRAVLASPIIEQITIWFGKLPVAAGIFVGYGKTFTYLYGASDHAYRQLMGPNLLQWEAVKHGKKLGYLQYDFFGIAPRQGAGEEYAYDALHQYGKVTRFKLGFGGTPHETPGTFDLLISAGKYRVYRALRRVRRLL